MRLMADTMSIFAPVMDDTVREPVCPMAFCSDAFAVPLPPPGGVIVTSSPLVALNLTGVLSVPPEPPTMKDPPVAKFSVLKNSPVEKPLLSFGKNVSVLPEKVPPPVPMLPGETKPGPSPGVNRFDCDCVG